MCSTNKTLIPRMGSMLQVFSEASACSRHVNTGTYMWIKYAAAARDDS